MNEPSSDTENNESCVFTSDTDSDFTDFSSSNSIRNDELNSYHSDLDSNFSNSDSDFERSSQTSVFTETNLIQNQSDISDLDNISDYTENSNLILSDVSDNNSISDKSEKSNLSLDQFNF